MDKRFGSLILSEIYFSNNSDGFVTFNIILLTYLFFSRQNIMCISYSEAEKRVGKK